MQIKRYYGKSVHAALEKAKAELGPDAILLHTRTLKSSILGGSTVEVIVAVDREAPSEIDEVIGDDEEKNEEPVERAKAILTANSYRRAEGGYELKHIGEELSEIGIYYTYSCQTSRGNNHWISPRRCKGSMKSSSRANLIRR